MYSNSRDNGSNTDKNKKGKIQEDGRGHVYQTLQLDDMDYESMYTHTVPPRRGEKLDITNYNI